MIKHSSIVLARKPLSEKSIAENVLKHGTGGINIDVSRIQFIKGDGWSYPNGAGGNTFHGQDRLDMEVESNSQGRFPANLMFDEEAGQVLDKQSGIGTSKSGGKSTGKNFGGQTTKDRDRIGHNDKGGASRFFYKTKNDI